MLPELFPDMDKRLREKELMDMDDADVGALLRTVRQFRYINFLFSSSRSLISSFFFKRMKPGQGKPYTLLDLGAGGCDIMVWAARKARRKGINLRIIALDYDRRIRGLAEETVRNYPEISFRQRSALDLSGMGNFDFIFSNHFLHHLGWKEIENIIQQAVKKTRIAFLFNDLKRSHFTYIAYALCASLFFRNGFALSDGLLSIRRGFLDRELKAFLHNRFPGVPVNVFTRWPGRIFLYYSRDNIT